MTDSGQSNFSVNMQMISVNDNRFTPNIFIDPIPQQAQVPSPHYKAQRARAQHPSNDEVFFRSWSQECSFFLTEIQLQLTLTRKTKDGELMKFLRQLFSMNTISSERQGSQQSSNSCPSKRTKYLQSYFTTTHTTKIKRCCVCLLINIPSIFRSRNKNFAKDDSSEFDCE